MRFKKFLRAVSGVVLVTFTALCANPTIAAVQATSRAKAAAAPREPGADEKYAKLLGEIEEQSKKAKRNRGQGKPSKAEAKAIRALERELAGLESALEAHFAAIGKHLDDRNLAEVIKQRHRDAVATYRTKQAEFKVLIRDLATADDVNTDTGRDAALLAMMEFFDKHPQARRRAPLDPNNLPWRMPKSQVRAPITDPKLFRTAQFGFETVKVAGTLPSATIIPKTLGPTPTSEDLTETEDIQITEAIRAKALELGGQPLEIYRWVRNNIEFFPTYGSVQGSDFTLQMKRGNASDTASLLMAMLRASNIPARYAYGTVDIPIDQAMNWVGGVTKPEAALNLLGQGGIPSVPVISGGKVTAIRMEHVWVEAWVDFLPSRGARHIEGDTWVPMDASFKQYTFKEGIDFGSHVPFDTNAFSNAAQEGSLINEFEGWVQNFNQANIQTYIANYQARVYDYVNQEKPNAAVRDIVGSQAIIGDNAKGFSGTLPHRLVARGNTYQVLPGVLRHQFRYSLYSNGYERSLDIPLWTFERSLPALAGKKVTLSFRPATQADADLLASYLPNPHPDGSPIQLTEVPTTLAAYASVVPELKIEDNVVATGGTFRIGAELAGSGGFTRYDFSGWDTTHDDTIVAGQVTSVGLSIQGISAAQLNSLKQRMELARSRIMAGDSALTKVLAEDTLASAVMAYFAGVEGLGKVARSFARVKESPALSYGLIHATAVPNKLFGIITTTVRMTGVLLDIGHLRHLRISQGNELTEVVKYNRVRGLQASALEHAIPEIFFVDRSTCEAVQSHGVVDTCPQAVSAVRAIHVAATQGQKVYVVNQSNQEVLDSLGVGAEVIDELKNAVASGKEVTIHERPLSIGEWHGSGYMVVDPDTGAGAYVIEGGANGGDLRGDLIAHLLGAIVLISLLILSFAAILAGFAVAAAAAGIAGIAAAVALVLGFELDVFTLAFARVLAATFIYFAIVAAAGPVLPIAVLLVEVFAVAGAISALLLEIVRLVSSRRRRPLRVRSIAGPPSCFPFGDLCNGQIARGS